MSRIPRLLPTFRIPPVNPPTDAMDGPVAGPVGRIPTVNLCPEDSKGKQNSDATGNLNHRTDHQVFPMEKFPVHFPWIVKRVFHVSILSESRRFVNRGSPRTAAPHHRHWRDDGICSPVQRWWDGVSVPQRPRPSTPLYGS